MKIYFTASVTGKPLYEENYKKIVSCLKNLGCKVFADHILYGSREKVYKETKEERLTFYKLLNKNIRWCDAMIAEVSYPSTGVGYEISLAVRSNKPVLALYFEKRGDYPFVLSALKEEEAVVMEYNLENLEEIIKDYIGFVRTKSLKKRFTMLLSPKTVNFLEKISRKERTPRSVYIRHLIEEDMQKRGEK